MNRFAEALNVLRRGKTLKAAPHMISWPTSTSEPEWRLIDLTAYIKEGFSLNTLIYSTVMYKARALRSAPLRAFIGSQENPELAPPDHPLSILCNRPNPHQSRFEFNDLLTVYFNVAGNAYIWFERSRDSELPTAMYTLRPDQVLIIPDSAKGGIKGYLFVPHGKTKKDGIPMLPQDIMHVKLPNPGDPLGGLGFGLSPITPLAQSGDVDNAVTRYLKRFFDRGTLFQSLITTKLPVDEAEIARIKKKWHDQYGGPDGDEVAVLDGTAADWQRVAPTFNEMGFESIDERNETRIHAPFGVAPILIGSRVGMKNSTYSNYETARKMTWEDTLIPDQDLFGDEYRYYLASDDGAFVMFDRSKTPALQRNMATLVEAAYKMWQMGTPANIAYTTVGIMAPATEAGAQGYLPSGVIPVGAPEALPSGEQGGADATAEPRKSLKTYSKTAVSDAVRALLDEWTTAFETASTEAFQTDLKECKALIGEAKKAAIHKASMIRWTELQGTIADYFKTNAVTNWQDTFIPVLEGMMIDVGKEWAQALGVAFNVRNLRAEEWFMDYVLKFAQPINETSSGVIHDVIGQAMAEGWSPDELTKRLGSVFDQWMTGELSAEDFEWLEQRMPDFRRELIARTELTHAANAGTHSLGKEWGAKKHSWLATGDDRTRDSHRNASGQSRNIDEPFNVGGYKMMYPGDTSLGAPVSEIADCRCTQLLSME